MSKQSKATAPVVATASQVVYVLSAKGTGLASKSGNTKQSATDIVDGVAIPVTGKGTGKVAMKQPVETGLSKVAGNTRVAALSALAALPAPFTGEQAVAALAPLQASGALGAGSKASGYWRWVVRTGLAVQA